MGVLSTGRQIGRTLKNAARLRTIVSVFAKHGFHNVAERVKLGKFILERLSTSADVEKLTPAERVRLSFEELGPTFVKLGQLLATRPDLVPEEFAAEFSKLHDHVQTLPFQVVEQVLAEEFGSQLYEYFESFDPEPIGAASIAQVHRAKLKDGTAVVIKVQRPGIIHVINDDLSVLYFLAGLLEKYVEETRPYNPIQIVDEYFKTLELETNFIVEANNLKRFSQNFSQEPDIKIPKVYFELTTERVLTMEALDGVPLSHESALLQPGVDSRELVKKCLRAYSKMVFNDGLFHGDLHPGNLFVMSHGGVGFIDFGVVGRLNHRSQSSVAAMLLALSKEDYEKVAHEFADMAPFDERVNVDLFAKQLRDLVAPYYGLSSKSVNIGKLLLRSSAVAARNYISVPAELMLFFKSMVAIEGLGKRMDKNFDFLTYSLNFASDLVKSQYDPNRIFGDFSQLAKESRTLINALPRQLNFLFRKFNSPEHAFKLQLKEFGEFKKSIEASFNLLFLGIIIGCLLLSASLIVTHPTEAMIAGIPTLSFIGYLAALVLGFAAVINYIKK